MTLLTDGMKAAIVATACLIVFMVTVAGMAALVGEKGETQGEKIRAAKLSCPKGLLAIKFATDGTQAVDRVVCK